MKTIILSVIIIIYLFLADLKGQEYVSFIFSAKYTCNYVELDSIRIDNISQGRDTVLYFPDTVLTVMLPNIDNIFGMTYNKLSISNGFPNPFTKKSRINVLVPENNPISLRAFDISGRLLDVLDLYLEAGIHEFDFYSGKSNYYIISVNSKNEKDDVKLMNIAQENNSNARIEYKGSKMIVLSKYFLFDIGDDLIFTGYATLDTEKGKDKIIDIPLIDSTFYTFLYENEVPEKPSEISGIFEFCENTDSVVYEVENIDNVNYTWLVPSDWEIVSGQGSNSIIVNIKQESGYVQVIPSNSCGSGEPEFVSVSVEVDMVPTFNNLGPYCVGDTPDSLPSVSTNDILGIWEPAVVDTDNTGVYTHTFITENACESVFTFDIIVEENVTPVFHNQLGPYCIGDTPDELPDETDNDLSLGGVWDPPVINTYIPDTTTYVFTANNACSSQTEMDIVVEKKMDPVFSQFGPYCIGAIPDELPECSNNGICGIWEPSEIDTGVEGTFIHTFTTDNACETSITMIIEVELDVTPIFNQLGPYCIGEVPNNLPICSDNGICGTWEPPIINTDVSGIGTYIFTADYVCESTDTMNVSIMGAPNPPQEGSHVASLYEIEWFWQPVGDAIGYLYNTVNDIASAKDNYNNTNYLQTNLICDKQYLLYVWAYNECDTSSVAIYSVSTIEHYSYEIGDICPAGGIIFYDKGNCNNQWQYLSVALFDLEISPGFFGFQWGCHGQTICLTLPDVGQGKNNTEYIVSSCTEQNYAAKVCSEFETIVEDIIYDDWFMPSKDEVLLIYDNLHSQFPHIGNFSNSRYWSSTESSGTNAYLINFDNGEVQSGTKWLTRRVRPVRAF